jgi:hypothetical protein
MKTVIHIGAPKCGSSSIQTFLQNNVRNFKERAFYISPKQNLIDEWDEGITSTLEPTINSKHSKYDVQIISHERFFHKINALKLVVDSVEQAASDNSTIISYIRPQGDYIVSEYGQWGFRSPASIANQKHSFDILHLNYHLFTGTERQMISYIYRNLWANANSPENTRLSWNTIYNAIVKEVLGSNTSMKIGLLPKDTHNYSLIDDFCEKAQLHLPDIYRKNNIISNSSFDKDLIEGLNSSMQLGYPTLPITAGNDHLIKLSKHLSKRESFTTPFINNLKDYFNSYYWQDNNKFCEKYGLDIEYFRPNQCWSKSAILERIQEEQASRSNRPDMIIDEYRQITAKLADLNLRLIQQSSSSVEEKISLTSSVRRILGL